MVLTSFLRPSSLSSSFDIFVISTFEVFLLTLTSTCPTPLFVALSNEFIISSISFYRNKAKHIKECSIQIIENYNGIVPASMEELTTLSGIGRKSANVIMLEAFNNCQGIAVDTHAHRLSNRLGLSNENDPSKIEQDLLKKIPKKYWRLMNHLLVYHGREVCKAKNPLCDKCTITSYCKYYKAYNKTHT